MHTLLTPPVIDTASIDVATRREFIALLGAAGLLSACGGDDDPGPETRTRTIDHALGRTEVPVDPRRIVSVTGIRDLEALLALEVPITAAAGDDDDLGGTTFADHLAPLLSGVEMLPSRRNINLERVAAVRPDLLVGTASWMEPVYGQLSGIAPTVVVDVDASWQDQLLFVGDMLGRRPQAEQYIARVDESVAALADRYGPTLRGRTFAVAKSFLDDGQIYIGTRKRSEASVPVLERLGLVMPPELVAAAASESSRISVEQMRLIDTDVIFLPRYEGATEQAQIDRLRADPLFSRLGAVQAGRVYEVMSPWWAIGGAIGVPLIVDDLSRTILPDLAPRLAG